ncbi:MAG: hypothetical protein DWQ07_15635 [Chloroflexi bacterium]|nr:MAG: hypothetical protein DWQ07_15635 [Chloroflexota bacterium]MBL1197233.1 hypothetical protein [Chloroflexota bacterium]
MRSIPLLLGNALIVICMMKKESKQQMDCQYVQRDRLGGRMVKISLKLARCGQTGTEQLQPGYMSS